MRARAWMCASGILALGFEHCRLRMCSKRKRRSPSRFPRHRDAPAKPAEAAGISRPAPAPMPRRVVRTPSQAPRPARRRQCRARPAGAAPATPTKSPAATSLPPSLRCRRKHDDRRANNQYPSTTTYGDIFRPVPGFNVSIWQGALGYGLSLRGTPTPSTAATSPTTSTACGE